MNKKKIICCALSLCSCKVIMAMDHGFLLPTKFTLETVFDKITTGNIWRTFTLTAGVTLLYKAADMLAQSKKPFPDSLHPFPTAEERILISQSRSRASWRYFITGCAFTVAGLLQKYGASIMAHLPTIKYRLFSRN